MVSPQRPPLCSPMAGRCLVPIFQLYQQHLTDLPVSHSLTHAALALRHVLAGASSYLLAAPPHHPDLLIGRSTLHSLLCHTHPLGELIQDPDCKYHLYAVDSQIDASRPAAPLVTCPKTQLPP